MSHRPEPMVLVDAAVVTPEGRAFWTTEDMFDAERLWPSWSSAEAAMTFFAFSKHTLVRHIRLGNNITDLTGEVLPPRRPQGVQAYVWRLWDIERLAYALAINGAIPGRKLARAVLMVKTCAELHEFL